MIGRRYGRPIGLVLNLETGRVDVMRGAPGGDGGINHGIEQSGAAIWTIGHWWTPLYARGSLHNTPPRTACRVGPRQNSWECA